MTEPTTEAGRRAQAALLTLSDSYYGVREAPRMADAIDAIDIAAIEREAVAAQDDLVAALRRQNHDAAAQRDRQTASLQAEVDGWRNAATRAREMVRGSPADWSNDAQAHEPDGWWNYTSQNNRDVLTAMVAALTVQPDDLSAAWAEAEAAMPEGWLLHLNGPWDGPTYRAWARCLHDQNCHAVSCHGSTPAEALRALAAKIREMNG